VEQVETELKTVPVVRTGTASSTYLLTPLVGDKASHYLVPNTGFVVQCSCCRRIRNQKQQAWEWITALARPEARLPSNATDSVSAYYCLLDARSALSDQRLLSVQVCDVCAVFFYGEKGMEVGSELPKVFFTDASACTVSLFSFGPRFVPA
jgi:hypothetical protein